MSEQRDVTALPREGRDSLIPTLPRDRPVSEIVLFAEPHLCHTQWYPGSRTLCGKVGETGELHDGEYVGGRCTGCGKRACKTCEILEDYS